MEGMVTCIGNGVGCIKERVVGHTTVEFTLYSYFEDWHNLKNNLEGKEKGELIEIIENLWNVLQEKQKELSRAHTARLNLPTQLLDGMDRFLDECDSVSPPLTELENPKSKTLEIPPMEEDFGMQQMNLNDYPKYQASLEEKSTIVQQRLSRLHRLSQRLCSVDIAGLSDEDDPPALNTAKPILTSEVSLHRVDDNVMSANVINELQLKTDCYECGAHLVRMLDPVNANEGIGIVCGGCNRARDDMEPSEFYYHCATCESLDLCITCVARRA